MYGIFKLIQKLVATLNSEGTPGQVAAGIALGTIFGLTPLLNLHNLVALAIVLLLRVTLPAVVLGWFISVPLGFALDPLFDALGQRLLDLLALTPFWTAVTNAPVLALTNLNNSVVLGSLVFWAVVAYPLFLLARWGVTRYRATIYQRLQRTKAYKAVRASKLYGVYRMFRPE
jgi:uncharacterized protein (TIGR03546 family)